MSRSVQVIIKGDARQLQRALLRGELRMTRSFLRRLVIRLELIRVRFSLWRTAERKS